MKTLTDIDQIEKLALSASSTQKEQELIKSVCGNIRDRLIWLQDNNYISEIESQTSSSDMIRDLLSRYSKHAPMHERAQREVNQQEEKRQYDEILTKLMSSANLQVRAAPSASPSGFTISDVVVAYCDERISAGNWQAKTFGENQAIYDIFAVSLKDKNFSEISYNDMREHKDKLKTLPKNHKKLKETRDLPLERVFSYPGLEPISTSTINKHFNRLTALFSWAKKQGYCTNNLAEGMGIKQNRKASSERDRFTVDELQTVFNANIFVDKKFKHTYQFWLPLLGLFTGARLGELAQLYVSDIYEKDSIWVIDINAHDNEKKLKNTASARIIPIHSELIRLGFLKFHSQQSNKSSNQRLFNTLRNERDGPGQAASKWFQRFRKSIGLNTTDGTKTFHSFRHTFIDTMKQLGIEEAKVAALAGHQNGSITFDRYGKAFNHTTLKNSLDCLKFEGLHLKRINWTDNNH